MGLATVPICIMAHLSGWYMSRYEYRPAHAAGDQGY